MKNGLQRLEAWYIAQCDGDWEHGDGIRINTLDNPGWAIDVNLEGTDYEEAVFDAVKIERSNENWIHAFREEATIKLRCGPGNLEESLIIFLNWAEE